MSNHVRDALTDALTAFKLSPNAQTRSAMLSAALELGPDWTPRGILRPSARRRRSNGLTRMFWRSRLGTGRSRLRRPGRELPACAQLGKVSLKGFETRPATIVTLKKLASGGILAFYDNGEAASFALDGKAIKTWTVVRAQDGETVTIQGRPAMSGDGSVVAVTTAAGSALVKCSNIEGTASARCETLVNSPAATAASVSDDGLWAAFGASDGRASIHSLGDAAAPAREVSVGARPVRGLAFDPAGNLIVSSNDRQFSVVNALDLTIKSPIGTVAQPVGGLGLTLDNESKIVAYGCGSSADESRARELCLGTPEASGDAELVEPRSGPRSKRPGERHPVDGDRAGREGNRGLGRGQLRLYLEIASEFSDECESRVGVGVALDWCVRSARREGHCGGG